MELSEKTKAEMQAGRRSVAIARAEEGIDVIREIFLARGDWRSRYLIASNFNGREVTLSVMCDGEVLIFSEDLFEFPSPKLMAQLQMIAP